LVADTAEHGRAQAQPRCADRGVGRRTAQVPGEAARILQPRADLLAVQVDRGAAHADQVEPLHLTPLRAACFAIDARKRTGAFMAGLRRRQRCAGRRRQPWKPRAWRLRALTPLAWTPLAWTPLAWTPR